MIAIDRARTARDLAPKIERLFALSADKIAALKERFGFTRLVCWFETGGIAGHANVLAAMRLFAERVMPKFQ